METVPVIHTQSLTRDFKKTRAVDSLNLVIYPGEIFGLIGPDGAGKTTTIRLLAGLLKITDGSATVAGYDLASQPEAIKAKIGYMAQQFSMYAELSVVENIAFFAEIYNVKASERIERTERLLSFAGLMDYKYRRGGHLSGGMQKKLALACVLIHKPPILLLDEPTTGVDPVSRREFWNILTELHKDWQTAKAFIEKLPGVLEVQTYGESLHLLVDSTKDPLPQIKKSLQNEGINYRRARPTPVRMEQAFISLIRRMDKNRETENM